MGDSGGEWQSFEAIGEDIGAAVSWAREKYPDAGLCLMGLCDGASAASMYDGPPVVDALILLNPWVHTERREAAATLRHYYLRRFLDRGFWRKVLGFRVDVRRSISEIGNMVRRVGSGEATIEYVQRMYAGLERFSGEVLLVMSGDDLTAREFDALLQSDARWRDLVRSGKFTRMDFPAADHTFSDRAQLSALNNAVLEWLPERAVMPCRDDARVTP
jgi:exosortase A-associated hydrolase 1